MVFALVEGLSMVFCIAELRTLFNWTKFDDSFEGVEGSCVCYKGGLTNCWALVITATSTTSSNLIGRVKRAYWLMLMKYGEGVVEDWITSVCWVQWIHVHILIVLGIWLMRVTGSSLTPSLLLVMTKFGVTIFLIESLFWVGRIVVALVSTGMVLSISSILRLILVLERIGGLLGLNPYTSLS